MSTIDLIPVLLKGVKVTVELTILAMILAFILSFIFGLARLSKYKLIRILSQIYVEVFRGTSLLVQLFWIYFALPILGVRLPTMAAGILVLALNYGAYGSEVVRNSIVSISQGQVEASIALNMTRHQMMRRIILPQAFRMMLPAFGNLQIELLKATSLVSLITLPDLTYQAMILNTSTLKTTQIFGLLLIIYFIISCPLTIGMHYLERRLSVGRN